MNKLMTFSLVAFVSLWLSACETSGQLYSMSQKGSGAFSCGEITRAFSAYKQDRQSASALSVLMPLVTSNSDKYTKGLSTSSSEYYEMAKSSANLVLMAQGCQLIY